MARPKPPFRRVASGVAGSEGRCQHTPRLRPVWQEHFKLPGDFKWQGFLEWPGDFKRPGERWLGGWETIGLQTAGRPGMAKRLVTAGKLGMAGRLQTGGRLGMAGRLQTAGRLQMAGRLQTVERQGDRWLGFRLPEDFRRPKMAERRRMAGPDWESWNGRETSNGRKTVG